MCGDVLAYAKLTNSKARSLDACMMGYCGVDREAGFGIVDENLRFGVGVTGRCLYVKNCAVMV